MSIAVFDLDGTLYTGHIVYGLTRYLLRHGRRWGRVATVWGRQLTLYPRYGLRRFDEEALRSRSLDNLGRLLTGLDEEQMARAADWVARNYVAPRWREDVVARARYHRDRGDRVILVSGTPEPMLPPIGALIGIEEVVGTVIERAGERYTGRVIPPGCQGAGKATRLTTYLGGEGAVPWEQIIAYADHHSDMTLLARAAQAVAVYPSESLRRHAEVAGWPIIPD